MGLDSFSTNGFDADEARYNRQNRMSEPDFAPGQEMGMDTDDIFSSSGVSNNNGLDDIFSTGTTGGGMDSIFNTGMSPSMNSMNLNQPMMQQGQEQASAEDKFWDILGKIFKSLGDMIKEFPNSFKSLTPLFYTRYGWVLLKVSLVAVAVGIVSSLVGWSGGMNLAVAGCLSSATGVMVFMFTNEKSRTCSSEYAESNNTIQTSSSNQGNNQNFNTSPASSLASNDFDNSSFDEPDWGGSSDDDFDVSDDDIDGDEYDDWGNSDWSDVVDSVPTQPAVDMDEALNNMVVMDKGMYTRQYLYDMFFKVLENNKPDYSTVRTVDEDSDIFLQWDEVVQRAGGVCGLKEDELPYLKALEENLFTMTLTITRTPKLKPELLGDEICKAYAAMTYDDEEDRAKVFCKTHTVLDECIITIFTGDSYLVTLKDLYKDAESFVLDSKNSIPIVLGFNEKGKVIYVDFKNIESIIVAGMPRSGKSWEVQAIITQMCALASPRDINFYILDPKAETSDFKSFVLPHVKKFASKYTDSNGNVVNSKYPGILDTLRYLVNVEAPRRKKIIGDNNNVNINDFKKSHPDVDLPIIYIIIDEMVTLSKMEKEDEKEYQSYLDMIVTQFPNLGIKGIFIPHEVKNQIISKTAYDSIKARISVKGSPEHIETSTGTKPKAFPYKLCNVGDMAVNIDAISASTRFIHGVALSTSNEKNNQLFDYLRRMWTRLEPDSVKGSWAERGQEAFENQELLNSLQDDTEDLELFSNSDENEISSFANVDAIDDSDDGFGDLF